MFKFRWSAAGMAAALFAVSALPSVATAADVKFVGTPSVRYEHDTVGVVVRLDRAPDKLSRVELFTAPSLQRGEQIERAYGGNSLGTVGRADRHCYVAEAARPEPRPALHDGATWEIGLSAGTKRIAETTRVTLKRERDSHWVSAMARRLGCYAG